MKNFAELLSASESKSLVHEGSLVLKGQYKRAHEAMTDACNAGLYVGLIGPVGSGKPHFAASLRAAWNALLSG